MPRIGPVTLKLLFLDVDGALHPSTEVADFATCGLTLAAYVQSRPDLLRWAPLLAEALNGSSCEIVVHSSWREQMLDGEIRVLLAPSGLAERFIGSTPKGTPRERSIQDVIRIMGVPLEDVLILDDAGDEFDALSTRLALCNPLLGVSDPTLLERVRRWAAGSAA